MMMAGSPLWLMNVQMWLTICIRWINQNLEDHEYFIGLYEVEDITSDNLVHVHVHAIKDTLLRMNLCVSNCEDSAMMGPLI